MLKTAIEKIKGGFDFLLSEFSIELKVLEVNPVLRMPKLNEAEIYSVIINAISNAVKAVIAVPRNRKIEIKVINEEACVKILFLDSGVGISKSEWKNVFEPFISDPEDKLYSVLFSALGDKQLATLGKGSGLGLHIVKSIVTKHNGIVEFVQAPQPWKTCLSIRILK